METCNASNDSLQTATRVSSLHVRALCEGVEYTGSTLNALAALARIDEAQITNPSAWVSLAEFDRLLLSAVRLSRDPAFGLHWAERTPMLQYGQLVSLVGSAPSLRAVLECAARFHPLLASRVECRFQEHGSRVLMHCDPFAVSALGLRVRTEFLLVATRRLFQYFGEHEAIVRVNVRHARPEYGLEYERLFGHVVHFEQEDDCMEFRKAALDTRRQNRDSELYEQLRVQVEVQRRRTLDELSGAERTEAVIRAALPRKLSIAEVAKELGMSARSLRRYLANERVTYGVVVNRVRRAVVEEMLSRGDKSMKEIAYALGYSGASPFHRAFRQWTGETPNNRRSQRGRALKRRNAQHEDLDLATSRPTTN